MSDVLCTQCGHVGPARAQHCSQCGAADVLPADAPSAQRFIARFRKPADAPPADGPSVRAEATGKVLGRSLGKLFGSK